MALLAATCSKIGAPPDVSETAPGTGQAQQPATLQVVAQNQVIQQGDVGGQTWVQLPQGGFAITPNGQIIQQQQTPQLITQGGVTYSVIPQAPQVQNVVDGTGIGEQAFIIPASGGGQMIVSGSQLQPQQSQGQVFLTQTGQIIRTQAPQQQIATAAFSGGNIVQNITLPVSGTAMTTGVNSGINIAGVQQSVQTLQNLGGTAVRAANNVIPTIQMPQVQTQVQTIPVQVPVSGANGQTILQTIQIPLQTIQPMQPAFQTGILQNTAVGGSQMTNIGGAITLQGLQQPQTQQIGDIQILPAPTKEENQTNAIQATNVNVQNLVNQPGADNTGGPAQPTILTVPQFTNFLSTINQNETVGVPSNATPAQTSTSVVSSLPQTVVTPSINTNVQLPQGTPQTITINQNGQIIQTLPGQNLQVAANGQLINTSSVIQATPNTTSNRPNGLQAVQVQNVQNVQTMPALQAVQGPQAQIVNGAMVQNVNTQGATSQLSPPPVQGQIQTITVGQAASVVAQGQGNTQILSGK